MSVDGEYIVRFLLVLLRTSIVFVLLPLFGSRLLPARFKIGMVLTLSIVITSVVDFRSLADEIPTLVFTEMIIGVVLGLVARAVFFATEMAGQLMSNMIGMSIANFFDPEFGSSTELSRFLSMLAILTLLCLDIHHEILLLFIRSYELLPAGAVSLEGLLQRLLKVIQFTGLLCLRIAAPVVILMLITNLAMGFISRAVPQMNIFFVTYPVYFFVGLTTILLSIPAYIYLFNVSYGRVKEELILTLKVAGG